MCTLLVMHVDYVFFSSGDNQNILIIGTLLDRFI